MQVKKPISIFFISPLKSGILNVYCSGKLYAQRPFNKGQQFKLNIPFKGLYTFEMDGARIVDVTDIQKKHFDISLPQPERNKNAYIKDIFFEDKGSSPARIFTDLNTIVVNRDFFNYPIEVRFFILLHEVGHFFYSTEWKCDNYAAYHFTKIGFNPTQAFESLAGVLHTKNGDGTKNERNEERIKKIYNLLKNNN